MTFGAVNAGYRERISDAVAATSGAAKLVPCTRQYPPPALAPNRLTAGATSTVGAPVSEPFQSDSVEPEPPAPPTAARSAAAAGTASALTSPATATTPASRAGYQTSRLVESAVTLPVQAITT